MRFRLTRLFTLLAILICLPLQGLAAVTMPSCQAHGQKMEVHVDADQSEFTSHCGHHHDGDQPSSNAPCDKCFYCHLNVTQAIIPFSLLLEVNGVAPMVSGLIAGIPETVPSSPFHPPRSTFA